MSGPSAITKAENWLNWSTNKDRMIGATATVLFALILYILAWVASDHVHESDHIQHWLDVGALTFGVVCGWLLGTLASPSAKQEEAFFSKAATAFSSFISGLIVSQAKDIIAMLAKPSYWTIPNTFRLLMWFTGLLLATATTYVLRAYLLPGGEEEKRIAANSANSTPITQTAASSSN
jgi:hypothetical protein